MDLSRSNSLHHFASSPVDPSDSSKSAIDLHKKGCPLESCISASQNKSYQELLNSPFDITGSAHSGIEDLHLLDSLASSSSFFGKLSTSHNEANVRAYDGDHLVHEYHHHLPSVEFQDCDRRVPFLFTGNPVSQFSASRYSHLVPEIVTSENIVQGHNILSPNGNGDYLLREIVENADNGDYLLREIVENADNGSTTTRKKRKVAQTKVKRKISRDSSGPEKSRKGHWSPDEDRLLLQQVERFGPRKWGKVAEKIEGRIGKQCRERWFNYLRPDLKTEGWTEKEDQIIIDAYEKMGSKWSVIQNFLHGRTENSIKNHWNTVKRRVENKLSDTGRPSSSTSYGKNIRLEKYILSLITSHPNRMPQFSRRHANKTAHDDSSVEEENEEDDDEDADEVFDDDQQENVDQNVFSVAKQTYNNNNSHEVKEDSANETFASNYYKVDPPVFQNDQHFTVGESSKMFENLDPGLMQQLNDYDMSSLINNQEDNWKAEMEAIKMIFAMDF